MAWTLGSATRAGGLTPRTVELQFLVPEGPVSLTVSFRTVNVVHSQQRIREALVDDFRHPLGGDWTVQAINLLLHWLADIIDRDRHCDLRGRGRAAELPSEYRIVASRLVTSLQHRHCFPCTQSVISASLRPFLDGDFTWRIDEAGVQLGIDEQRRQSAAARKEAAEERRAEAAVARQQWQQELQQNAAALQAMLPDLDRGYVNALMQGLGRTPSVEDERKVAANLATDVSFLETGVATEQWFIAQLKRRLTSYRPSETRLHGQFDRPEILDLEMVRGLRGECDLRVQMLSGGWSGVQTKTLSHMDGNSYQFACTNKWSPLLLIAAADNTYQHFALVWAQDTYGPSFTITFGVAAATEHTARVILKTDNHVDFINQLIQLLPQAVAAPHSRPAGTMMTDNTWMELHSLQFIGAKCTSLGIPWAAANRADSAHDLLVNFGHRVQVKSSKTGRGVFHLSRMHWDRERRVRVLRPYRASDFDFLMLVLLPSNNVGSIASWVIPMEQLRRQGLVTYYNEEGVLIAGAERMVVDIRQQPGWNQPFREAWHLLQQRAVVEGTPIRGETE